MKKLISMLLTLLMVFSTISIATVPSAAAYENTYKNTGNQRNDIVGVALTQIGYREGNNNDTKYGVWYGLNYQPWCAMFVSWCARQAGISTSVLKNSAVAAPDSQYFNIPYYNGSSYTPKPGDLFFTKDWSHVGIVYYIDGNYFYTIEGNSNDSGSSEGIGVFSLKRAISSYYFGVPNYSGSSSTTHTHSFSGSNFEAAHPHKVYQTCSCGAFQYTGATRAYVNCSTCMKLSTAYVMPVKAYAISDDKVTVYDKVNGSAKANKIYGWEDECTITQIYDCGWCKVTFPVGSGTDTGYVKTSTFFGALKVKINASKNITTYTKSDMKTTYKTALSGKNIWISTVSSDKTKVQILYPSSDGKTFYSGWAKTSDFPITVKFNANGGTGTMANQSTKYANGLTLTANAFKKTGYKFAGWNLYRNSDKKWCTTSNGYQTATQITNNNYSKKVFYDKYAPAFTSPYYDGTGASSETFIFYATWTPNTLKVAYNANGGTVTSDTYKLTNNLVYKKADNTQYFQSWTYNVAKSNGLVNNSTFGLTRTGYRFVGWGSNASGSTIYDQDDTTLLPEKIHTGLETADQTKTLFAIWEPITYTVSYNANGGTGAPANQTKTYGTNLTLSTTKPTKDGYTFLGWAKSSTATAIDFNAGDTYSANSALTLYAVWKANAVAHTHTWDSDYTIDLNPTCSRVGSKSIHCSSCGETKDATTIPMLNHTEIIDEAVAAGCVTTGLTEGKHCSVCGAVIVAQEIVPELGHDFPDDHTIDVEPTCTENGIAYSHCTRCDYRGNMIYIPALGHSLGAWSVIQEPDCINDGEKERACANCDYTESESIPALGHSFSSSFTIDIEETCTEDGMKSRHCFDCTEITDETVIPAKGHEYGSWTTTKAATCTASGTKTRTCLNCSATDTQTITALGHDYSSSYTIDKAATCTQAGEKSRHCSRCEARTSVTTITKLNHTLGSWSITTQPTCTETGVKTRECINCDYSETATVSAKGHNYSAVYTTIEQATCTQAGYMANHCIECGEIGDTIEIPAIGHISSEWIIDTEATCEENGSKHTECTACKEILETAEISATGHILGEWYVETEPTVDEEGVKARACENCDFIERLPIDKLPSEQPQEPTGMLGDVNLDGKVSVVDAKWILQSVAGTRTLTDEQKANADVNKDEKISVVDAKWILQSVAGTRVL